MNVKTLKKEILEQTKAYYMLVHKAQQQRAIVGGGGGVKYLMKGAYLMKKKW